MFRTIVAAASVFASSLVLTWGTAAVAIELPASTKKMIAELKLDPKIFDGTEDEYVVPAEWREGAKKEGTLRVVGTWERDQVAKVIAPFRERYPGIKVDFTFGNRETRSIKPLMSYKAGRSIAEIIDGMSAVYFEYKKADALMYLGDLPNIKYVPAELREPDGLLVPHIQIHWCVSYNTNKVKLSELPKTWDGFLDAKTWGNKRIGVGNRPNLWLLQLWALNGKEWGTDYIHRFFRDVKPQLRKEGMDAMISLVSLGEFDVGMPSAGYRTSQTDDKGAPVGWYCPEPVPTTVQSLSAFKNNAAPNSTRLFVNWLLSKEGQMAQNYATASASVRDDLQLKEFLPYPDQVLGRKRAPRDLEQLLEPLEELSEVWNKEWQGER